MVILTSMGIRAGSSPTNPMYTAGQTVGPWQGVCVGGLFHSALGYTDWGEGNLPNAHHNLSHSSFSPQRHLHPTSRAAAVPTPASAMAISPPCSHPGTTGHRLWQSLVQHKANSCLSGCFRGGTATSRPGLFKSLSREGVKKPKNVSQSSLHACRRGLGH